MLHGDEVHTIDRVQIKDRANVGVVQRGGQTCFALKAAQVSLFRSKLRRQNFYDDSAAQLGIGGFIDGALPADANLFGDAIIAQGLADHGFRKASCWLATTCESLSTTQVSVRGLTMDLPIRSQANSMLYSGSLKRRDQLVCCCCGCANLADYDAGRVIRERRCFKDSCPRCEGRCE